MTINQLKMAITMADEVTWNVYGLRIVQAGHPTFVNALPAGLDTWPKLEAFAKAIGFETWPIVHTISRI